MANPAYVTIPMIAAHTGKHRDTVAKALKAAGAVGDKIPGVHGLRFELRATNVFLHRQWPNIPPMRPVQ